MPANFIKMDNQRGLALGPIVEIVEGHYRRLGRFSLIPTDSYNSADNPNLERIGLSTNPNCTLEYHGSIALDPVVKSVRTSEVYNLQKISSNGLYWNPHDFTDARTIAHVGSENGDMRTLYAWVSRR